MRLTRIVGALVALILAATMSQAFLAPVDAAGKPKHDLVAHGKEIGNTDKFIAYGKVSTYPSGKIKVLRNISGGPFKVWKKIKTRSDGKFRTRIYQAGRKRTCFKIQVPATSIYKRTTSPNIGCIFTT
jgi:hypothetical protein